LIDGLPNDGPKRGKSKHMGRHQWACKQAVRLACAVRLGCISETDWREAQILLDKRLRQLRNATGEKTPRREVPGAFRFGIDKAATKTDEQARAELGDHAHSSAESNDSGDGTTEFATPVPLSDALGTFRKRLHMNDVGPVLIVAAAVVANLADGDPVWVLIVG
jgi:hypothetical protein